MKKFINLKAIIFLVVIIVLVLLYIGSRRNFNPEKTNPILLATTTNNQVQGPTISNLSTVNIDEESNTGKIFSYYLNIATTTFSQNKNIDMTLFIYNLSSTTQTLNFKNGCQASYVIGDFDMLKHIVCRPDPTSFSIEPHGIQRINLTHYPSVYTLSPGKYSLITSVVGYGGITTPITITQ